MPQYRHTKQPPPAPAPDILRRACRLSAIEGIESGSEWKFLVKLKGAHFKCLFIESIIAELDRTRTPPALRDVPSLLRRVYVELCQAYEDPDWKRERAKSERNMDALDNMLRFLDAAETSLPLIRCN